MPTNNKPFADALTAGIIRIKANTSLSVRQIEDRLGLATGKTGRTAIEYWRKGYPPHRQILEKLLMEMMILSNGDLDEPWLRNILKTANYAEPDLFCGRFFSPQTISSRENLDTLTHRSRKFVGRKEDLQTIQEILHTPGSPSVITIVGLGGIGKTALAFEIYSRERLNKKFVQSIWINETGGVLTFDEVLIQLGRGLGHPSIAKMSLIDRKFFIQSRAEATPILVVLDNLETAGQDQQDIVERLIPLLGQGKIIATSRKRFSGDLFQILLPGLTEQESSEYMKEVARNQNILRLFSATQEQLKQIHVSTGGSPEAIKLIVGQLASSDLEIALKYLREARPLGLNRDEDEYVNFYRRIYEWSWTFLSESSKSLLIACAHFAPEVGGVFDALQKVSAIPAEVLPGYIHELWQHSLLEVSSALTPTRYALHTLTRNFVLSDILDMLAHNQTNIEHHIVVNT